VIGLSTFDTATSATEAYGGVAAAIILVALFGIAFVRAKRNRSQRPELFHIHQQTAAAPAVPDTESDQPGLFKRRKTVVDSASTNRMIYTSDRAKGTFEVVNSAASEQTSTHKQDAHFEPYSSMENKKTAEFGYVNQKYTEKKG
jgi:hypothetical protein